MRTNDLLTRFILALVNNPGLLPHLEWTVQNVHSETLEALLDLASLFTPEEIRKLLTVLEAYRQAHNRNRRLIRFTRSEKLILSYAEEHGPNHKDMAAALGIGRPNLFKTVQRLKRKIFDSEGNRLRLSTRVVVQLVHYPFARLSDRLTRKEIRLLRCMGDGVPDAEIRRRLKLRHEEFEALEELVNDKTGLPFLTEFLRSGALDRIGEARP